MLKIIQIICLIQRTFVLLFYLFIIKTTKRLLFGYYLGLFSIILYIIGDDQIIYSKYRLVSFRNTLFVTFLLFFLDIIKWER
jgi:hypothetical protein